MRRFCARSSPHARIAALDASAALELPGVVGVLTGADVAAMSAHSRPASTAACRTGPRRTRWRATPASRWPSSSLATGTSPRTQLELIQVEYEPLDPVLDVEAAVETGGVRPRPLVPLRRCRRRVRGGRPRRARALPVPALELHAGGVLRRRRRLGPADGDADRLGELPGALHPSFGRGGGAAAARLEAEADHAAGLGRLVRDQVCGLRLRRPDRPRRPPLRRPRALDRGPPRASRGELRVNRARDRARGRLLGRGRAAGASLRRDRGRRRVRARAGAGDAVPDARLTERCVPGAERRCQESGGARRIAVRPG